MTKKGVLLLALVAAIVAALFPPWGFRGETFDHFASAFERNPTLTNYSGVRAMIVWHLLAIEMLIITLLGAVGYVLAKR